MSWLLAADLSPGLLEERHLIQLTQDAPGVDSVDTDVLASVLAGAEAEVDGYLAARHSLPLVTVPALVRQLGARVARYHLHTRRPGTVSEELRSDYTAAVKQLRDIASGLIVLGVPEPSPNPERIIRTTGRDRVFGRGNLGGF